MANDIKNWAKTITVGDRNAKVIFLEIADVANADGYSWYSIQTIARTLEASTKTVERGIALLADKGLITRSDREKQSGRFRSKGTQINIPADDWADIIESRNQRRKPTDNLSDGVVLPTDNLSDGSSHQQTNCLTAESDQQTICPAPTDNLSNGQNDALSISNNEVITEPLEESEENTQTACVRVRETERRDFRAIVSSGIAAVLKVKTLPDKTDWLKPLDYAFEQGISPPEAVEVFALMRRQKWRKGRITPETWKNNLPNLPKLREEIDEQDAENQSNKLPVTDRDKRKIAEVRIIGEIRERRRLQRSNAGNR